MMLELIFDDKNKQPEENLLSQKLSEVYPFWQEIIKFTEDKCGGISKEWKFYGKNYGWQLKIVLKKRNLFFLIPYDSFFKVVFIFGDKAVDKIEQSDISNVIKDDLRKAKRYMEGRGIAIEVRQRTSLPDIKSLLQIKLEN